jgi:hypothetical protein
VELKIWEIGILKMKMNGSKEGLGWRGNDNRVDGGDRIIKYYED